VEQNIQEEVKTFDLQQTALFNSIIRLEYICKLLHNYERKQVDEITHDFIYDQNEDK
jgi:hypothetical protein